MKKKLVNMIGTGIAIGVAIGAAMGNVGLGIALGAALGSTMQKEDSSSGESEKISIAKDLAQLRGFLFVD